VNFRMFLSIPLAILKVIFDDRKSETVWISLGDDMRTPVDHLSFRKEEEIIIFAFI
jgi:hypothetical protein